MPRLSFGRPKPLVNLLLTPAFAASGQVATGTVRVADWPRARDAVVDPSVEIGYRIEGGRDPGGRPTLTLTLSGTVEVVCQRSLHPMAWKLGRETVVLLAKDQQEADRWDREVEDAEVVVADQPLDAGTLLEDELLLSLPFAPLCDDPACAIKIQRAAAGEQPVGAVEETSPFAALKGSKISKSTH
jgi:uncharacterized protein